VFHAVIGHFFLPTQKPNTRIWHWADGATPPILRMATVPWRFTWNSPCLAYTHYPSRASPGVVLVQPTAPSHILTCLGVDPLPHCLPSGLPWRVGSLLHSNKLVSPFFCLLLFYWQIPPSGLRIRQMFVITYLRVFSWRYVPMSRGRQFKPSRVLVSRAKIPPAFA